MLERNRNCSRLTKNEIKSLARNILNTVNKNIKDINETVDKNVKESWQISNNVDKNVKIYLSKSIQFLDVIRSFQKEGLDLLPVYSTRDNLINFEKSIKDRLTRFFYLKECGGPEDHITEYSTREKGYGNESFQNLVAQLSVENIIARSKNIKRIKADKVSSLLKEKGIEDHFLHSIRYLVDYQL